jgi:hypothetical protein
MLGPFYSGHLKILVSLSKLEDTVKPYFLYQAGRGSKSEYSFLPMVKISRVFRHF